MKIDENNIRTFLLPLSISIGFCILFYVYFVKSLDLLGGFLLGLGLPTIFLYIMGLYIVLTPGEEKRKIVGWIMVFYTFLSIMYGSVWIALSDTMPSSKSAQYVFEEISIILTISAIWYSFSIPIFWSYKMKKHLYGALISLLTIVIFLLLYWEWIL